MLIHDDRYADACPAWHGNDRALSQPDWEATLWQAQEVGGNRALCEWCLRAGVVATLERLVAEGRVVRLSDGLYRKAEGNDV